MNTKLALILAAVVVIANSLERLLVSLAMLRRLPNVPNAGQPPPEHLILRIMRAGGPWYVLAALVPFIALQIFGPERSAGDDLMSAAEEKSASLTTDIQAQLRTVDLEVSRDDIENALEDVIEDPPVLSQSEFESVIAEIEQQDDPKLVADVDEALQSPLEAIAGSIAVQSGKPETETKIKDAISADASLVTDLGEQTALAVAAESEDVVLEELGKRSLFEGVTLGLAVAAGVIALLSVVPVVWRPPSSRPAGGTAAPPPGAP